MGDEHLRCAVAEDVADLLGVEVPVDGHGVSAEANGGVGGFQKGDVVAHEDRDAVALADAEGGEA